MFDLKAYDLLDIGLCNLSINQQTLHSSRWAELMPESLDRPARAAYLDTLSQLREVFWITITSLARGHGPIRGAGVCLNEAVPIMTREPVFDRLRSDPRPIEAHIEKVPISTSDPREMIGMWRQLIANANISYITRPVRYRYLLTSGYDQAPGDICRLGEAERYLEEERSGWRTSLERLALFGRELPHYDWWGKVDAAFGFWLFPVDVDDRAPFGLAEDDPLRSGQVLSLSGNWPELGLSGMGP